MPHTCIANQAAVGVAECDLLIAAYVLAGLAMMLNIRLSYSSAPYALIRFRLPENLFSVFVRRMASALELWCLPSMLLGNIMDLIQKLALNTDDKLRKNAGAGASAGDGKLRALALALHTNAEALNTAVIADDAALKQKAGIGAQNTNPEYLRKLASDLHNAAVKLAGAAPGHSTSSEDALKKKAGTDENDGLRKLAKALYEAAHALAQAVSSGTEGQREAQLLADAVGAREDTITGIRHKLQLLAQASTGGLNAAARAVRDAYKDNSGEGVEKKFKAVKAQDTSKKYTNHQLLYQAIEEAWNAFESLYTTDLKQLATALKEAVGAEGAGLRGALTALGDHDETQGSELPGKAGAVRDAYQSSNGRDGVKPKFTALQKLETSYQAIASIKSLYDKVVSAMDAFDKVYHSKAKALADAVGQGENSGLQKALKDLYDQGTGTELPALAKAVRDAFTGWGGVNSKFNDVLAQKQEDLYGQYKNTTSQYKGLLEAWTKFNNKYYEVISYPKYYSILVPSMVTQWLNFLTYVLLLFVYVMGGQQGHLTIFYFVIAISGVVFGINMTLVYSVDFNYIPVYIAGENSFPIVTSFIHYITTLMFGNRRKWNSDFIVVCVDIVVAIIISLVAAVVWTYGYLCKSKYASANDKDASDWHHIFSHPFEGNFSPEVISPFLMIVVGMGLVYAIYPGIAPGMIVPFYLIDKIEMVLLVATLFPPVIVACLRRFTPFGDPKSPMCKWDSEGFYGKGSGLHWHLFDLLIPIMIHLAAMFIYSLHYRNSNLSRSIINQPKMSTALSITFYMCHECLLAIGFPGLVGANGGGDYVLIPQYIGALFMIFLAFYSEGYIIEYKSHDPAHWHIEGMWYLYGYYRLNPNFLL